MEGEEIRDAVEARELRVWTEDLWETAADVRVDLEDTRPGILSCYRCYRCYFVMSQSRPKFGASVVSDQSHFQIVCVRNPWDAVI